MVTRPVHEAARGSVDSERSIEIFGYQVRIAPWLLDQLGRLVAQEAPAHTIVVVTDDEVAPLHLPAAVGSLRHFLPHARTLFRVVPAGEQTKTRESWASLTDWMLDERCGRDTTLVALGGGVIGDLAGFVAATFMRGIPFVHCPTSLLAMVDASVGGKVGVDTPAGKNLVGAFHQPNAVVIDPTVLQTLPKSHRRAGLAEVIKHGIIADERYLAEAVSIGPALVAGSMLDWHGVALADLIARSVEIKASVVRQDEREVGVRRTLNFGHTIGHAIEAASDFTILHGNAIAIGMVLESALAEHIGVASTGTHAAVRGAVAAVGLPDTRPSTLDPHALIERMRGDKKVSGGRFIFALPSRVGVMAGTDQGYGIPVGETDILAVL